MKKIIMIGNPVNSMVGFSEEITADIATKSKIIGIPINSVNSCQCLRRKNNFITFLLVK